MSQDFKVWYIPPTRASESIGLPSPRDFPRAGKARRYFILFHYVFFREVA